MIASASAARFDGLFRSSERSIHFAGIRTNRLWARVHSPDTRENQRNGDASWDAGIPVVASRFDRGANEFDRIYENVRLIGPDMDKLIAL